MVSSMVLGRVTVELLCDCLKQSSAVAPAESSGAVGRKRSEPAPLTPVLCTESYAFMR